MTISRVNGAGWGANEKLSSAQANGMDLNATYALDKRTGQTDTLASTVTVTGTLTFFGAHASGGLTLTSALVVLGDRIEIRGDGIDVQTGAFVVFETGSTLQTESGSTLKLKSGTTATIECAVSLSSVITTTASGVIAIASTGYLDIGASAAMDMEGTLHCTSGSASHVDSGATLTLASGSTLAGTITETASVTKSGTGAWTANRRLILTDADQTITGTEYDTVKIPQSAGAGRKYKLTKSPTPPDGCRIRFYRESSGSNNVSITFDDNTGRANGTFPSGQSLVCWVDFEYDSALGEWEACASNGTT